MSRLSEGRTTPVTKELSAELIPGCLYIGIYFRDLLLPLKPHEMFHVLLATVEPENPRVIRKYHAVNPINPETEKREWKYENTEQTIPSGSLVALVQVCEHLLFVSLGYLLTRRPARTGLWADVHDRVKLKDIPLAVPSWMDPVQYPKFTCKVWLMEALRRICVMSDTQLDISQLMIHIQTIGMKYIDLVLINGVPIPVIQSQFFCD